MGVPGADGGVVRSPGLPHLAAPLAYQAAVLVCVLGGEPVGNGHQAGLGGGRQLGELGSPDDHPLVQGRLQRREVPTPGALTRVTGV